MAMRKVMELPGDWELHANDERHPFLVHKRDKTTVEPKAFSTRAIAPEVYRALKLEEDRIGREREGAEWHADWVCIWSARVVLGDFINRNVEDIPNHDAAQEAAANADRIFNEEIEKAVRAEQLERARMWN